MALYAAKRTLRMVLNLLLAILLVYAILTSEMAVTNASPLYLPLG